MKCPNCDYENPETETLCGECNTELSPGADGGTVGPLTRAPTTPPPSPESGGSGPGPQEGVCEPEKTALQGEKRYRKLKELGSGGMGVVWKEEDLVFKPPRVVAIKRLLTTGHDRQQAIDRFLQEASVVAHLNHINIVTVHDVDKDEDGHYIVMEYVEGKTLAKLIEDAGKEAAEKDKKKGLSLESAMPLARGIISALSYAHKKKVIHRDIKPSNVMVTPDGLPKVLDFGLARMGIESDLSIVGNGMGTLFYAAPEQRRDARNVDHRADIYSLGKTLYVMLTGESPETNNTDRLPAGFDKIILKCVEENPDDRYGSVDELLGDLERLAYPEPPRPPEPEEDASIRCLECEKHNIAQAKFCRECGAGLFFDCARCGIESRQGSVHCDHCGANFEVVEEVEARLKRAAVLIGQGKYASAIEELDQILKLEPEHTKAAELREQTVTRQDGIFELRAKGMSLFEAQEYGQAAPVLQKYLELVPDDAEFKDHMKVVRSKMERAEDCLERAKTLLRGNDYPAALNELDAFLALEPTHEEALAIRDETARTQARATELRDRFRGLHDAENFEESRRALKEYLDLVPQDEEARKWEEELLLKEIEKVSPKTTLDIDCLEGLIGKLPPGSEKKKRESQLREARLKKLVGEIESLIKCGALDDAEVRLNEAMHGDSKNPELLRLRATAQARRARNRIKGLCRSIIVLSCIIVVLSLAIGEVVYQIDSRCVRRGWIFIEVGDEQKARYEYESVILPWLQGDEYDNLENRLGVSG